MEDFEVDGNNILEMDDDELFRRLKDFQGVDVGPITNTTRSVYQRKLAKLLGGDVDESVETGGGDEYDNENDFEEFIPPSPPKEFVFKSPQEVRHRGHHEEVPFSSPPVVNRDGRFSSGIDDTPSPRPPIRGGYSQTPRPEDIVSQVVEQVPEPVAAKKSSTSWLVKIIILLVVALLIYIIFQTIESNPVPAIPHFPETKDDKLT